jgi:AraC family transcriptional regulator
LAEIAADLRRALKEKAFNGSAGRAAARIVAAGRGWSVADVVCTSGPEDVPFEEQHRNASVAMVLAGSFQYRSALGEAVMTPGSVMLGNPGQCYECGHEHANGDRCLAFWYTPDYFEQLAADAGAIEPRFTTSRVPAVAGLSPLVTSAAAALLTPGAECWEELSVRVASCSFALAGRVRRSPAPPHDAAARVTRVIRLIESHAAGPLTLADLAREAGLSPYHFLRTFARVTGVTPHQFLRRTRLREAALRLVAQPDNVLDIALDTGFGDVSNFNRVFRAEFGESPRSYRRSTKQTLARRAARTCLRV